MVSCAASTENGALNKPFESYESGEYLAKNPTWDDEDSVWKAGRVLEIMRRNDLHCETIVDVGCGAGGVLAALSQELSDTRLFGFEISPHAARFWERHGNSGIQFRVGDFLREETDVFDLLLLLDVFEHVPDPFEFLSSLRGRAEYFIFHIPLYLNAVSVVREKPLLHVRNKVGHIHYYTRGLALALLNECGYDVLDWAYTGAAFSAPQAGLKTRFARLPRRLLYAINRELGVRLLGGDTLIVLARPG